MSHTSAPQHHSHPRGVEGSELPSAKHATVEPAVETKASSLQRPSPELEIPTARAAGAITRTCPACGATKRHALRFRTNGCDILECRDCGLGRTETFGFDPAAYYTEDYFSRVRAQRRFYSQLSPQRKPAGLGATYGFFLMEAARHFALRLPLRLHVLHRPSLCMCGGHRAVSPITCSLPPQQGQA
jgi:hypothetical protein